jgi:hypothetical protein
LYPYRLPFPYFLLWQMGDLFGCIYIQRISGMDPGKDIVLSTFEDFV